MEGDFELLGEQGKKNGEKRLRRLFARTSEWNSAAARSELASSLEARAAKSSGEMATRLRNVAEIVRAKRSASLGKRDLLLCSRAWGYSSDVWYRHGRATRAADASGRGKPVVIAAQPPLPYPGPFPPPSADPEHPEEAEAEEVAASDAQPAPFTPISPAAYDAPPTLLERRMSGGGFVWASPTDVSQLTAESAWAAAQTQLTPLAFACTSLFAGREARDLFSKPGAPVPHPSDVDSLRRAVSVLVSREANIRSMVGLTQQAQLQGGQGAAAADEPASAVLAGSDTHTETMLRCFATSMREHALRLNDTGSSADLGLVHTLHEAEREANQSLQRGFVASSELALRLQTLLADAKHTPITVFLSIERTVHNVLLTFIVSAVRAFQERLDWVEAISAAHEQFAQLQKSSVSWAGQLKLALDTCEAAGSAASSSGCGAKPNPALVLAHPNTPPGSCGLFAA